MKNKVVRFLFNNSFPIALLAAAAFMGWVTVESLNNAMLPNGNSGTKVTLYVDPLLHPLNRGEEWTKVHKAEVFDRAEKKWKEVLLMSRAARTAMESGKYTIVYAPAPGTVMGDSEKPAFQGGFLRADLRGSLREL